MTPHALGLAALLALAAALPIPQPHARRDAPQLHVAPPQPIRAPHAPPSGHVPVPVPQGGSFHNETHWWVPDTVHHGAVEAGQAKGDNTHVAGRRVQMHVVKGRARTSWA